MRRVCPSVIAALMVASCLCATASATVYLTVKKTGATSSQYSTITKALAAIPSGRSSSTTRYTILIYPGTYNEKLKITAAMGPVTLQGVSSTTNGVLIRNACAATGTGTSGCSACTGGEWSSETLYVGAASFIARNLSIANYACNFDHSKAGQSFAVQVRADKVSFFNVRMYGGQDTFYTGDASHRVYYYKGFVNGSVDPIFGYGAAYFYGSEISITNYITAHKGDSTYLSAYLFDSCTLSKPSGASTYSTYLGRPWGQYARVIYKSCSMANHIIKVGWSDWSHSCSTSSSSWCKNVIYAEYASSGAGAAASSRVAWSKQLTATQAATYTQTSVLRSWSVPKNADDTSCSATSSCTSSQKCGTITSGCTTISCGTCSSSQTCSNHTCVSSSKRSVRASDPQSGNSSSFKVIDSRDNSWFGNWTSLSMNVTATSGTHGIGARYGQSGSGRSGDCIGWKVDVNETDSTANVKFCVTYKGKENCTVAAEGVAWNTSAGNNITATMEVTDKYINNFVFINSNPASKLNFSVAVKSFPNVGQAYSLHDGNESSLYSHISTDSKTVMNVTMRACQTHADFESFVSYFLSSANTSFRIRPLNTSDCIPDSPTSNETLMNVTDYDDVRRKRAAEELVSVFEVTLTDEGTSTPSSILANLFKEGMLDQSARFFNAPDIAAIEVMTSTAAPGVVVIEAAAGAGGAGGLSAGAIGGIAAGAAVAGVAVCSAVAAGVVVAVKRRNEGQEEKSGNVLPQKSLRTPAPAGGIDLSGEVHSSITARAAPVAQ